MSGELRRECFISSWRSRTGLEEPVLDSLFKTRKVTQHRLFTAVHTHTRKGIHGRGFRVFRASPCFRVPEEDPMTLKVVLEEGADGYIIAECPQIPGCMSQGKTKEEALANIKNTVQACLKVMIEKRRCIA